ncbi:uroporphyrinogen-III C-methyltransferase [Paenibacillus sp. JNUCC31]|uniref:uroporphyrinogen-III C-methyltransferase n=1 Tax=Paenibacillus sp. JNUCC-31 TaxID=2777983 RepID=UPI001780437B|nr:uroporphyrinogen-III C-methyltransferase [Paenibacillus sp. JNUCC-31]QOS77877.1 uroporphyrinogen-III C-methyltransferase [Paenibacillus sp. JNUCC-31]
MKPSAPPSDIHHTRSAKGKAGSSVKLFLVMWIVLIALGVLGAYYYSNHLQQQMITQLQTHNQQQIATLKADYEKQLTTISQEISDLQGQVQSFNELLTFTKDNANDKTDNSNKLYTQLSEVKKQLETLQKKMDLLK